MQPSHILENPWWLSLSILAHRAELSTFTCIHSLPEIEDLTMTRELSIDQTAVAGLCGVLKKHDVSLYQTV